MEYLIQQAESGSAQSAFIGLQGKDIVFHNMEDFLRMGDEEHQRPKTQWWLSLRPIHQVLAQPGPRPRIESEATAGDGGRSRESNSNR
jgi:6-phosphofructokinase 1